MGKRAKGQKTLMLQEALAGLHLDWFSRARTIVLCSLHLDQSLLCVEGSSGSSHCKSTVSLTGGSVEPHVVLHELQGSHSGCLIYTLRTNPQPAIRTTSTHHEIWVYYTSTSKACMSVSQNLMVLQLRAASRAWNRYPPTSRRLPDTPAHAAHEEAHEVCQNRSGLKAHLQWSGVTGDKWGKRLSEGKTEA